MSFLEVSGISLQEEGGSVLQNISFTQQENQKIAIAGETGSGKSTLLQAIAGFVQPSAGEVWFEGKKVIGPVDKLVPGHPGIAYLSQQYELPQFLRVEQVLRYANTLAGKEADALYDVCRISHLLKRKTNQLSGGERQRIALAKLLITSPRLLLLDEPFSNLDNVHKNTLKAVIQDIGEELDITCLLISHDPTDTLSWADKILVMQAGQILQQGTPEQIYTQPLNAYAAGLFGKYNILTPAQAAAFLGQTGIASKQKRILVRPENIKLVPGPQQGLRATVKSRRYFGSHYEIEALLADDSITISTTEPPVNEDGTIYVSLTSNTINYI